MKKIGIIAALCMVCFTLGRFSYAVEVSQPSWYLNFTATVKKWKHNIIVETPIEARGTLQDEPGEEFLKDNEGQKNYGSEYKSPVQLP